MVTQQPKISIIQYWWHTMYETIKNQCGKITRVTQSYQACATLRIIYFLKQVCRIIIFESVLFQFQNALPRQCVYSIGNRNVSIVFSIHSKNDQYVLLTSVTLVITFVGIKDGQQNQLCTVLQAAAIQKNTKTIRIILDVNVIHVTMSSP